MKNVKTMLLVLFVAITFGLSTVLTVEACDHDDEYIENEAE